MCACACACAWESVNVCVYVCVCERDVWVILAYVRERVDTRLIRDCHCNDPNLIRPAICLLMTTGRRAKCGRRQWQNALLASFLFSLFLSPPTFPLTNPLSALAKLLLLLLLDLETQHKIHWNLAVSLPVPAQSYWLFTGPANKPTNDKQIKTTTMKRTKSRGNKRNNNRRIYGWVHWNTRSCL